MGELSDYYIDKQIDEEFKHFHHDKIPSKKEYIWLASNGKEFKVKNMTDSHIINTLRCLENGKIKFDSGYELNLWKYIMREECNGRGLKI